MDSTPIISLVSDVNFGKIMRRATRNGLLWDDFLSMPLPAGMSALETWKTVAALRRFSAFRVPYEEVDGYGIWYAPTAFLSHAAAVVDNQCREASPLSQLLMSTQGNYYRTRFQVNETINCAQRDGLALGPKTALDALEREIGSKKPDMRLLRNIFTMMESLGAYRDTPFSVELIESLGHRICQGVNFDAIPRSREDPSNPSDAPASEAHLTPFERTQLNALCDYANGQTGDPFEHALFKALIFRTGVCTYCPHRKLAYIISQLCFNLFSIKAGLPLLSLLPFTETVLEWESETNTRGNHEAEFASSNLGSVAANTIDDEEKLVDFSPLLTVATWAILQSLRKLEALVAEREQSAQETVKRLRGGEGLNRRQLTVLENLCRSRPSSYTIRQHQISQKVAYATARADLLDLVEKGFLCQEKQSKGFVFLPTDALRTSEEGHPSQG
ncbi:hypothetical protein VIN30_03600 [Adlercreutzia sp. R7]|uniref:Fido domain-containing protein n=1 Tax=Adlercreutzia wanghongyangiae TaxID=3111451 RepID=A0ABU6IGF4_9ACTN|nr:hypothetical protein [Adlercreutzia sp. R7]